MRLKNYNYLVALIPLTFILGGCLFPVMWSKPGYIISIEVQKTNKKAASSLEDALKELSFDMLEERRKGERCDLYSRRVVVDKRIEHPYVRTVVCYSADQESDQLNDFRILIYNDWDGQDSQLKKEIDKVADILIAELKKLVGEENIKVERKATSPPF